MPPSMTDAEAAERHARILTAARWCFLRFGFSKTSLENIAKRARLSRTLIYRIFKDKEAVFTAVFAAWWVPRQPAAKKAAVGPGAAYDRLVEVCKLMVVEPWMDMVGAPMGGEFFGVCERIDPAIGAQPREVALDCVAAVLGDKETAEVFLLSLDGLLSDQPTVALLERRIAVLAERFIPPPRNRKLDLLLCDLSQVADGKRAASTP